MTVARRAAWTWICSSTWTPTVNAGNLALMKTTPLRLEIFTDFICPWCYLATAAVARLKQANALDIQWRPFPLHPGTPAEGMPLSELLPGVDLDAVHARLYALMDDLGLEHGPRDRTYNSRLAQELAQWAQTQTGGDALPPLFYRAYFVDNRNLADTAILLDLVRKAGLDVVAAKTALYTRQFGAAVDQNWELAREYGISGVPAFIAGGYQLTGFHPAGELQRFIDHVQAAQQGS